MLYTKRTLLGVLAATASGVQAIDLGGESLAKSRQSSPLLTVRSGRVR